MKTEDDGFVINDEDKDAPPKKAKVGSKKGKPSASSRAGAESSSENKGNKKSRTKASQENEIKVEEEDDDSTVPAKKSQKRAKASTANVKTEDDEFRTVFKKQSRKKAKTAEKSQVKVAAEDQKPEAPLNTTRAKRSINRTKVNYEESDEDVAEHNSESDDQKPLLDLDGTVNEIPRLGRKDRKNSGEAATQKGKSGRKITK